MGKAQRGRDIRNYNISPKTGIHTSTCRLCSIIWKLMVIVLLKEGIETFMPIHQTQGTKSGWGLHKVLNHYGADKPVNYITADFYDKLETIYANMNATDPMGKDVVETLKKMDEIRTLSRSHIIKRVMSVR